MSRSVLAVTMTSESDAALAAALENSLPPRPYASPYPRMKVFCKILSVGRLVQKKGFDILLNALISLGEKEGPSIELVLAGDGPMRVELESLASRLPSSVQVEFLGETTNNRVMELMKLLKGSWLKGKI